jgi:hypothetical protein
MHFRNWKGSEGIFTAINTSLDGGVPIAPNFRSVLTMLRFRPASIISVKPNVYVSGLVGTESDLAKCLRHESRIIHVAVTPRYEHKWYEILRANLPHEPVPLTGHRHRRSCWDRLWIGTDHLIGTVERW